VIQEPKED